MPDRTFLDWPFLDDEHRAFAGELERWCAERLGDGEGDDEYQAVVNLVPQLGEAGWLRYAVPASHGGASQRLDVRSLCLVRETLARFSGLADFAFAMQGLGAGPISLFGSEALKQRYLPDVGSGRSIAAFALSEEQAGSDVAAITTRARRDGPDYVIDGTKTWISNAGIASFYVIFARTEEGRGGIGAFVVDADTAGLEVTEKIPVISPHPLGSLSLTECRIPRSQRLGADGEGFKIAMATLDVFRTTVGAAALGFARRALDEALRRCKERVVFERKLSEFQMTRQKLADMAAAIDASALLVYRAAWASDRPGGRATRETAMAKLVATESAQRVIDEAVQIFGGLGVVTGSAVERLYREIRPLRIYEGTTEIQKLIIARELLDRERTSDRGE